VTTNSSRLENSRRQPERLENSRRQMRVEQRTTPGEHPRQQQKTLQNKLTTTETREERERERERDTHTHTHNGLQKQQVLEVKSS
jgi:hypothetical protein